MINLVQHVRHADPAHPLYEFLPYPAVRLCVSHPVAEALEASGRVNGPIRVIENAVDRSGWPTPNPWDRRRIDVVICGYKQPALAEQLAGRLPSDLVVRLSTRFEARERFLSAIADARVVVCLPNRTEGFYLPALEAMLQGALVVCPDCIGNRDFCRDGESCWVPGWNPDQLESATLEALSADPPSRHRLRQAVDQLAAWHSPERERKELQNVLVQLDALWGQTRPLADV